MLNVPLLFSCFDEYSYKAAFNNMKEKKFKHIVDYLSKNQI